MQEWARQIQNGSIVNALNWVEKSRAERIPKHKYVLSGFSSLPHNGAAWKICSTKESNALAKRENNQRRKKQKQREKNMKNHWHFPIHFESITVTLLSSSREKESIHKITSKKCVFPHTRPFITSRFIGFYWNCRLFCAENTWFTNKNVSIVLKTNCSNCVHIVYIFQIKKKQIIIQRENKLK